MTVIWVSSTSGVMMGVMLGMFDVCQVHQTTWIWCPYSWFPSGKTWVWPCWPDGLERNCFWAVSSLFSPDGLERRCCHDIWLQISSVSSVDSAIGALNLVGSSTFQYFSYCSGCPLNGACALFVVKELDFFLDCENA